MTSLFKHLALVASVYVIMASAAANTMTLKSKDIAHGDLMGKTHEFQGFGCSGDNQSPALSWSGAPKGTKAFAVFAYDPDAPTGSGWWHWQVINIPADVSSLRTGAGALNSSLLPKVSRQMRNDYGFNGFGGACPPKGHEAHRYQFTVYALSQNIEVPKDASAALTGYMVNANALDSATIEALYKR